MRVETGAQAKGVYEGQWFRKLKRVDVPREEAWKTASQRSQKGTTVMRQVHGDIYFSIAHQGEFSDGDKEFSNVERI